MEISDIKQRLSILTVLQHYNLKPDRNNQKNAPSTKTISQAAVFMQIQTLSIASAVIPRRPNRIY